MALPLIGLRLVTSIPLVFSLPSVQGVQWNLNVLDPSPVRAPKSIKDSLWLNKGSQTTWISERLPFRDPYLSSSSLSPPASAESESWSLEQLPPLFPISLLCLEHLCTKLSWHQREKLVNISPIPTMVTLNQTHTEMVIKQPVQCGLMAGLVERKSKIWFRLWP